MTRAWRSSVLDGGHKMILKAVARGDDSDVESPALDNLLATRLVARTEGGLRVTAEGEAALTAGKKTRFERIALWVAAISAVVLLLAQLVEYLT